MMLSPIQKEIVETSGNLIVRASAGTGKTHTMVSKIKHDIEENHTHKVVAAITFTIKAAAEIKDRLNIDVSEHFIGTNNSFAIEEIIKPFMKDVYGKDYKLDMSTDYSVRVGTLDEGIEKIRTEQILCSYINSKKNFIFQLALEILKNSSACQLYLKSKYFKIYVDEYQDCDKDMHALFMYLCETLKIDTFVVGDETRPLYKEVNDLSSVVMLCTTTANWVSAVVPYLDKNKRCALLRYSNANSEIGAKELTEKGVEFTYVPQTPISDITTEAAWLYNAIAKHFILPTYSAYDLRDENPNEVVGNKHILQTIKISLKHLDEYLKQADKDSFAKEVEQLANSLGYSTKDEHCKKVYETICDKKFHPAFNIDGLQRIAITFHSSKGLEFDQVVLFASDYRLATEQDICNHYVATTRAKSKLILIYTSDDKNAEIYAKNIISLLAKSHLKMRDIATVVNCKNRLKV